MNVLSNQMEFPFLFSECTIYKETEIPLWFHWALFLIGQVFSIYQHIWGCGSVIDEENISNLPYRFKAF